MGVVAVYALNAEMQRIRGEVKNGMVTSLSYIMAKTILVIPIMFLFACCALGVQMFVIQTVPGEAFIRSVVLFASLAYVFECAAEFFAVLFDDPIMGMLNYMQVWFAAFLFAGFLVPLRDLYWPFKVFYYTLPYAYYIRSFMYVSFTESSFEPCFDMQATGFAVCVPSSDGGDVLADLGRVFPLVENVDQVWRDVAIMLGLAMFWKVLSVVTIVVKNQRASKIIRPYGSSSKRSSS